MLSVALGRCVDLVHELQPQLQPVGARLKARRPGFWGESNHFGARWVVRCRAEPCSLDHASTETETTEPQLYLRDLFVFKRFCGGSPNHQHERSGWVHTTLRLRLVHCIFHIQASTRSTRALRSAGTAPARKSSGESVFPPSAQPRPL